MNYRLFVAIDFPDEIKRELKEIAFALPGARWTKPENLHLTLFFIGEVNEEKFKAIASALDGIHPPEFFLSLRGLGYFSRGKQPKILWVGVNDASSLLLLHKKIQGTLHEIGIRPERNKFSPHITLARLNNTPEARLGNYLSDFGLFSTSSFGVNALTLFSSKLTPKGAVYTAEFKYKLSVI